MKVFNILYIIINNWVWITGPPKKRVFLFCINNHIFPSLCSIWSDVDLICPKSSDSIFQRPNSLRWKLFIPINLIKVPCKWFQRITESLWCKKIMKNKIIFWNFYDKIKTRYNLRLNLKKGVLLFLNWKTTPNKYQQLSDELEESLNTW